jgi:hypothetical protein
MQSAGRARLIKSSITHSWFGWKTWQPSVHGIKVEGNQQVGQIDGVFNHVVLVWLENVAAFCGIRVENDL